MIFMRNVDVTKPLESHFDTYAPSFPNALENVNFRQVGVILTYTYVPKALLRRSSQ